MKKFCIFYIIYIPLLLLVSYAAWGSKYSIMVQVAAFFFTGMIVVVAQLCIRDNFLKKVKSLDYKLYQTMSDVSSYEKIYDINIDPDGQYSADIRKLISWLKLYSWGALTTVLLAFVLAFLSTAG